MKQEAFTGDHDAVVEILPWYVNDTLDERERAIVRRHLEDCSACRADAEMLSTVQQVVRRDSPAPLVPAPDVDGLFDRLGSSSTYEPRWRSRHIVAVAASLVGIAIIAAILYVQRGLAPEPLTRYETVTSPPASDAIDYVIEIKFGAESGVERHEEILDALGFGEAVAVTHESTYRVTVGLDALSLEDLERYIETIEARPEIAVARVIAVQLPVE